MRFVRVIKFVNVVRAAESVPSIPALPDGAGVVGQGIIIVAVVRKDLVKAGRERERKREKGHEDTSIKGKPVTSGSE